MYNCFKNWDAQYDNKPGTYTVHQKINNEVANTIWFNTDIELIHRDYDGED